MMDRRAIACGIPANRLLPTLLRFYASAVIEGVHPLQAGHIRRRFRRDRRPGLPLESPLVFYPRYAWELLSKQLRRHRLGRQYEAIRRRVEADPARASYRDLALTPVTEAELGELEIFSATDSAKQAVAKAQRLRPPPRKVAV